MAHGMCSALPSRSVSRHRLLKGRLGSSQYSVSSMTCFRLGLPRTDGRPQCCNNVFGVCRDAVLVQIQAVEFTFLRDAEYSEGIHRIHDCHRDCEGRTGNDQASYGLSPQEMQPTSVKKAGERSGVVGRHGAGGSVFAAGKETQGQGSPDTAPPVYWNRADGVIDTKPLQHLDT